tara:strand:+ start:44 stop:262 length:219 start_codon:yes stop_codon:yes gene_type:complete
MIKEHVSELVEKLQRVENEMKLLQQDKRDLFVDYKDKVDIKTFKAAWSIVKKLENVNETELDNILEVMKNLE